MIGENSRLRLAFDSIIHIATHRRLIQIASAAAFVGGGVASFSLWTGKLQRVNSFAIQKFCNAAGLWWQFKITCDSGWVCFREGTFAFKNVKLTRQDQSQINGVLSIGSLTGKLVEPKLSALISSNMRDEMDKDLHFDDLKASNVVGVIQVNKSNINLAEATSAAAHRIIDKAITQPNKKARDFIATAVLVEVLFAFANSNNR